MVTLVAVTLFAPGTAVDAIWSAKPAEHRHLTALGPWIGAVFALLAVVFATAAYGAFSRKRWGRGLAIALFAINGAADASRMLSGAWEEGLIGMIVACLILAWLATPNVRAAFPN